MAQVQHSGIMIQFVQIVYYKIYNNYKLCLNCKIYISTVSNTKKINMRKFIKIYKNQVESLIKRKCSNHKTKYFV